MKNKYLFYLVVLFAAGTHIANAQVPPAGSVTGIVKDGQARVIDGASIRLLNAGDSALVKTSVSDKQGKFELSKIETGNYLLAITTVGYATFYTSVFQVKEDNPAIRLKDIELKKENSALQEVTVTGKRPMIEIKPDRTVVNVEASVTNTGATALEVLEKSPGVFIDKDGRISLKGKQGVMVMIDGKPSYLSGTDLTNLLSSMNANQLDQIEIMPNPPSKYDAAGNSGIINIKTKKNKATGFNGNISLGYGQGRYAKTNNSISLNYRNKKYNAFVNYSANANKGYNDLHIFRSYAGLDGKTPVAFFDQPTYLTMINTSNNLKAGLDYYLSPKTTIGFVSTGFISPRKVDNTSTGYLQNATGATDSVVSTISKQHNSWKNGTLNLNYFHQFDSTRELIT